jgi:predicted ATPase/DNA-binding CsgD family transcriptional regulator
MPAVTTGQYSNLPVELSSFVGRRRELSELRGLLAASRLVTVTGVGGAGKTRLAVRVAAEARRGFGGEVWFVDLTQLANRGLPSREIHEVDVLACLVLAALGLRQNGDASPVRQLAEFLADKSALVVLDNCEHLIPACAWLADALLRLCPAVRILATSREPLTIPGEVLYPLPPLLVPGPHLDLDPARLAEYESVALFLARARASVPDFAITDGNAGAVAELCRRLDGLPLAIELAASRVRVLQPAQILQRLADRFTALARGSHGAPARQQTLRACVEWSFDLCGKPERLLWARLSVFVGGFELDAVEGVCADDCLPAGDLLDVLTALIDKSIVERADPGNGGTARYRVLQLIRDYGQEQLVEAGEQATLRRRHRDWYQALAARALAERISRRQVYWIARLTAEHANVREAVDFCLSQPGEAEAVLRLLTSLPWLYWWSPGFSGEGLGWLGRALEQATGPTPVRARALLLAGYLAAWAGAADTMRRRTDEGERLARQVGDAAAVALAGFVRGTAAYLRNDLAVTIGADEKALAILATLPGADQRREEALHLQLLLQLGPAAADFGDHERARHCFGQALELAEARGASVNQVWALWGLALVAWRQGSTAEADRQARQCLWLAREVGMPDPYVAVLAVELLAWIAAGQRRYRRAAILLGAVGTVLTNLGRHLTATVLAEHDACERQARGVLAEAAFVDALRYGRALSIDGALTLALDEPRRPAPPSQAEATPLTRREHQIAEIVAQGRSNKEIAAVLFISQRTVESHVEHILGKLGFTSRAQIAAWTVGQCRAELS